jgi:hypothetical protein
VKRPKDSPYEAAIQNKILLYLNNQPGTWAVKFPAVLQRGLPDIVGCVHGRFMGLEVKRPGRDVTPLQAVTLAKIRRAGGLTAVAHNVEEVKTVLAERDS